MLYWLCLLSLLLGILGQSVQSAEQKWAAVTLDNDIFLGYDSGYTNGLYFSWIKVADQGDRLQPNWLSAPLSWSISERANTTIQAYALGQTMVTPEDITLENPPLDDMPYVGYLRFASTFITMEDTRADSVGTVIGVVGPSSRAEEAQTLIHELVGADEPKGWDTQLRDEVVFQLTRGRLWRIWSASDDRKDLLVMGQVGLGTLSSFVSSGMMVRMGGKLSSTFATPLLINTRSANPAAIEGEWYVFAGIQFEYIFNQIFADGNTYKESRTIDYDASQIGLTSGLAYSWDNVSLTFALYDSNVSDSQSRGLSQFGTLTFGWRF